VAWHRAWRQYRGDLAALRYLNGSVAPAWRQAPHHISIHNKNACLAGQQQLASPAAINGVLSSVAKSKKHITMSVATHRTPRCAHGGWRRMAYRRALWQKKTAKHDHRHINSR